MIGMMIGVRRHDDDARAKSAQGAAQLRQALARSDLAVFPPKPSDRRTPCPEPRQCPPHLAGSQAAKGRRRPALRAGMGRVAVRQRDDRDARPPADCACDQATAAQRFVVGVRSNDDNPARTRQAQDLCGCKPTERSEAMRVRHGCAMPS